MHHLGLEGSERSDAFRTARAKLSSTDPNGHMLWTGPMPADHRRPIVQVNGIRMDAARFARVACGLPDLDPDIPLERNLALCRVEECFAPDHFVEGKPKIDKTPFFEVLETLYVMRYPKPQYPRPSKWDTLAHPGEDLCPLGHHLEVYGDRRLRKTYCATCQIPWNTWHRHYRDFQTHLSVPGPSPVEDYIVKFWRTASEAERLDIPRLWERLDDFYYREHNSPLTPAQVHESMTGPAPYVDPNMTMQEAVEGMFDEPEDTRTLTEAMDAFFANMETSA